MNKKTMLLVITLITVRVVTCLDPATVDLLTPLKQYGEACGYEACPAVKEGMLNVHIVPHTHGELGYTGTFYEHYTGYNDFYPKSDVNMKRILDYVITELWAQSYRTFTLSDFPYFFHWWSQRDGTVRRMVYHLLRQGRLILVGGGWGMNDEACTSYHAIIDSYTYSLRKLNATFMECGRPLVAWQADVFGHSREFTSLAAQMGFDGLFVNPMSFDDELARMTRQGLEFLWRGSDDLGRVSDMFTHKLFDGYWAPPGFCFSSLCADPLIITSDTVLSNAEERLDAFLESVRFRQAPSYNTSHIMVMMGQVFGYFDASVWFRNIDKLIDFVNEKSYRLRKNIHLTYSAPPCYLKAVHQSNPVFETKQDDMFPMAPDRFSYMSGMYTSYPDLKLLAREGLVFLQMSKQLQVLARLFNNDKVFEEFIWIVGVFQDHNIITGAMRDYVKSYYIEKMYHAIQKSTLLLKQAFNKLRNCPTGTLYYRCHLNISSCSNIGSSVFIHIYNPLAWNVSIPVRLPVENKQYTVYDPKGKIMNTALVKIPEHVQNIPLRETVADYELVFMAKDIPPLGYRTYFLKKLFRRKRSIIKKLKKRNKKFLTRQTNNKKDGKFVRESSDYAYFDDDYDEETTTELALPKIIFGNVTRSTEVADYSDVVTPAIQPKIIFGNVNNNINADETGIVKPNSKYDISTEPTSEPTTTDQNSETDEFDIDRDITISTEKVTTTIKNTEIVTRSESSIDSDKNIEIVTRAESSIDSDENTEIVTRTESSIDSDENIEIVTRTESSIDSDENIEIVTRTESSIDSDENTEIVTRTESSIDSDENIEIVTRTESSIDSDENIEIVTRTESSIDSDENIEIVTRTESSIDSDENIEIVTRTESSTDTGEYIDMVTRTESSTGPDEYIEMGTRTESSTDSDVSIVTRTESSSDTEEQIENLKKIADEHRELTLRRFMKKYDGERKLFYEKKPQTTQIPVVTGQDQNNTDIEDSLKEIIRLHYGNVTERNYEVTRTTTEKNSDTHNWKQSDSYVPSNKKELNDTRRSGKPRPGLFIENKYITINLDPASKKISGVVLSNGVNMSLDIQFYYYVSDVPKQMGRDHMRDPGVYIFRSIDNIPVPIIDYLDTQIYKNDVLEELHTSYSDYASIAVRLYSDQPVIEVEWLVGPVPVDDGLGKEVFIRYMTDLDNDGAFYTDSNGRQTVKRMRNLRPMYDIVNNDPVSGNYYPVTTKIYIEDTTKNIRFSVFNDRSQGGTSLYDGEIDLMLQRRILTTDCSVESFVNETHDGIGVMIRGKHYLYISKADYKPNKMFEKKFAKEIELRPQIFVSVDNPYGEDSVEHWKTHKNEMTFLKNKLPVGVHVLTLEEWNEGTILLRLENFLEKADTVKSGKKKVFIRNLFTNIIINGVRETTLAANMWLKDFVPLQWNPKEKYVRSFNEFYASMKKVEYTKDEVLNPVEDVDIDAGILLVPQQIRTFVCQFEYV